MNKFEIDKKLQEDCIFIKDFTLSQLLLMNDSNYPWLILVPRKKNIIEIIDLDFQDQIQLLKEINDVSNILKYKFKADKINIANLGNVVAQLHIHIIARYYDDISFPSPIWGKVKCSKYHISDIERIKDIFTSS